jgi:predicted PurR-regulated permease PerM
LPFESVTGNRPTASQATAESRRAGGRVQEPLPAPRHRPFITVAISGRTVLVGTAVLVALALAARLADLVVVLFAAMLLAVAIDQPVGWLQRRRVPRPVGALVVLAAVATVAVGVLAALVPFLAGELQTLQRDLPGYANELERLADRLAPGSSEQISLDATTQQLTSHLNTIATQVTGLTLRAGRILLLVFATVVLGYFLALDPTVGRRFAARFLPPAVVTRYDAVATRIRLRIAAWVRGQIVVAASFGLALGLGLRLLGVPYAAALGAAAALLEIVPYLGGAVTIVLAVLAASTVGLPQVIGVLVLYVVLINLETHVLLPILLGRAIGLPSVAVLIALLAGASVLGAVGALIAVPTAIFAWAIVDELWPAPVRRDSEPALGDQQSLDDGACGPEPHTVQP